MDFLQTIIERNEALNILLATGLFAGSFILAMYVLSFFRNTLCNWVLAKQVFLTKKHLHRLSAIMACFIPVSGFTFALSFLDLPRVLTSFAYTLSLIISQILFLFLLNSIVIPLLKNWFDVDFSRLETEGRKEDWRRKKEDYLSKRERLLLTVRMIFIFISGGIILVDFDIYSNVVLIIVLSVIGIGIVLCSTLIFQLKGFFKKKKGGLDLQTSQKVGTTVEKGDPDSELRISIVELFLKIYSYQLSRKSECPAKYSHRETKNLQNRHVYDLQVKVNGNWKSRRMTIGRLGTEVDSRSKCFYVVFDVYLVVKIPPDPITDIKEYIGMLRKETRIASKLNMKECIIPSLSVIMRHVHHSFRRETTILEEVEDSYLKPLFIFSYLHDFLKINGSFVFFMDLSKYFFLQDAVENIHNSKESVFEEMCEDSAGIGISYLNDRHLARSKLFNTKISNVYAEYESKFKVIQSNRKGMASPTPLWIKNAFFMRLAGNIDTDLLDGSSQDLSNSVNQLIDEIFFKHKPVIVSYQKAVRESVYESTFKRNKVSMGGIVTNLLDLLARLEKKEVAMRDLKPDNLLVAGDRDQYPGFLASPKKFKVGLIDVETAVIYDKSNKRILEQPQLGGTDQYATPSHFFDNRTLVELFGGVAQPLHFQDWYATIAICYRVIRGEVLFDKTAGLISVIVREIRNSLLKGGSFSVIAKEMSSLFWRQATIEFEQKVTCNKKFFKDLEISVTNDARELIKTYLINDYRDVAQNLKLLLSNRKLFASKKNRTYLLSLSSVKLGKLQKKWETGTDSSLSDEKRRGIVESLREYGKLKELLESHKKMVELLSSPTTQISVYEILRTMFAVVQKNMCKKEWRGGDTAKVDVGVSGKQVEKHETTKATMNWQSL